MEIQKLFVSLLLDAADYTGGLDDAQKEASSFRDRIGATIGDGFKIAQGVAVAAAAAIAVAVVAIGAAAFSVSSDVATATANIQAELGTTAEEAERLGDIATDVWGNNFAGSITEAAGAVGLIRQQLGDLADDELQRATENAFRLQDVFGIEVPESVDAAKTLMQQFGLSSEEAFDFIATGFQKGLNSSDDFLDTIGEYSVQFASGGADAGQFFSLLESGMQGGMLGTDKAADAFKEFRVRIQDGSTATAEALEMIGLSSEEISEQMANGSLTAADAFTLVTDALANVDDQNIQMQAGVGLLGTQFEDLGTEGALALSLIGTELGDMTGAVGSLDAKYNTLGSAVEGYKRKALLALQPIGDILLDIANSAMPLVDQAFAVFETNIAPAIETVAGLVQSFMNNLSEGMSPLNAFIEAIWDIAPPEVLAFLVDLRDNVLPGLSAWFTANVQPIIDMALGFVGWQDVLIALGIVLASVILPILGSLLLSILAIAAPIVAVIAIVALLRTAWEQNWGGIQEKTAAAVEFIRGVITAVMAGVQAFWAENGEAIMAKAREIWTGIQTAVNTAITTIQTIITTISTAIQTFWATHGETIMAAAATAWEFIQGIVETVTSVISTVFAAFKLAFEGDWEGFGETLRTAWDTAWAKISEIFTTIKDTIIEIAAGLILDLIAKFQDTDWAQVGWDIINGIAGAITAGAGAIAEAAQNAAQAALDAAKAFLGIDSPSKVAAMQIGEPFTEGLALGLGDVAPIQRSVADLVNEMTLPFATVQPQINAETTATAVSSPALSGGSSTTINIDARGTDAPTVDRLRGIIREELATSGRRADVRIRTG
jgi:phage-related minor tail protein